MKCLVLNQLVDVREPAGSSKGVLLLLPGEHSEEETK